MADTDGEEPDDYNEEQPFLPSRREKSTRCTSEYGDDRIEDEGGDENLAEDFDQCVTGRSAKQKAPDHLETETKGEPIS